MDLLQIIFLAILQGLTEFLPISSSAHLLLPSLVLGWADQGLAFDVAVHVGTLAAVLFYYRADLLRMAGSWLQSMRGGAVSDDSRLVWYLLAASIPAGLLGVVGYDFIEANLRAIPVLATTTLAFGLLLAVADRVSADPGKGRALSLWVALIIGLAQALAVIPGVSRSGITMTAAMCLGLDRQSSARFSFLVSIPVIGGAGLLQLVDLLESTTPVDWVSLGLGTVVSGVTAYLCIAVFLRLLDRVGLMPFVYYRVGLAAVLYALWLI
ncbi:MAG: undecaprenyl-diphosphate phosphatase [Halioglobus sp.]|nr:undecaprenyl-diphosphate phosphatase [Halioglobus sp.]